MPHLIRALEYGGGVVVRGVSDMWAWSGMGWRSIILVTMAGWLWWADVGVVV